MTTQTRLQLFPTTTTVNAADQPARLTIANCDLVALAKTYGTPLYLYDQATMDAAVEEYKRALARFYPGESAITHAGKAFLCVAAAQWTQRHDLWLDCTGAGELGVAAVAGVSNRRLLVHGVNKSVADLEAAIAQAGVIVVDNLTELARLAAIASDGAVRIPDLWLRIRPGVAVDTHSYRQTGQQESKFGLSPDEAMAAVALCQERRLPLTGIHFHQGSHFHDPGPIGPALETVLETVALLRAQHGWMPQVISPGGGWGVAYHEDELPHPPIADYVKFVAERLVAGCADRDLPLPRLQVEPGRSLVARAGVALYTVGAIKQSGTRRWLLLDGGMSDNIRPALYGARYSALPVVAPLREALAPAWLAGPYCESGDVLIEDLPMPELATGELVAIPASGAYHLNMASNYNGARRPAVLWLDQGRAQLIQRRETIEDLVARDVGLK